MSPRQARCESREVAGRDRLAYSNRPGFSRLTAFPGLTRSHHGRKAVVCLGVAVRRYCVGQHWTRICGLNGPVWFTAIVIAAVFALAAFDC